MAQNDPEDCFVLLCYVSFLPFSGVNCLLGGSASCEEGSVVGADEAGERWVGYPIPASREPQPLPEQMAAWKGLSGASPTPPISEKVSFRMHLGCWVLRAEQW